MAKRLGVRVIRFSIGYPPRVWGFRRGETDYSIGATPLGGYVRMLGDEVAEEPSAATLEGYIKEIELDLLEAARQTGWLAASGKSGDEALAAIASELAPPPGGAIPSDRARTILGHQPNVEEDLVLREVAKAGTVKRAREILCEGRPSALIERFNLRAFPSQPLSHRIAIVLAGPARQHPFRSDSALLCFHDRSSRDPAGHRTNSAQQARSGRRPSHGRRGNFGRRRAYRDVGGAGAHHPEERRQTAAIRSCAARPVRPIS